MIPVPPPAIGLHVAIPGIVEHVHRRVRRLPGLTSNTCAEHSRLKLPLNLSEKTRIPAHLAPQGPVVYSPPPPSQASSLPHPSSTPAPPAPPLFPLPAPGLLFQHFHEDSIVPTELCQQCTGVLCNLASIVNSLLFQMELK